MLTLDQLRKDTQFAKERLAHKNFKDIHFVDEIIVLDDKRKLVKSYLDDFLSQRNSFSKEISVLLKDVKKKKAYQKFLKSNKKFPFETVFSNARSLYILDSLTPMRMINNAKPIAPPM